MKDKETKIGFFKSIRIKLIIYFCLLFITILVTTELIHMMGDPITQRIGWEGQLKVEAFGGLNLIADLKKERILRWIEERHDDTHVFASNDFTVSAVAELLGTIEALMKKNIKDADLWVRIHQEKSYTELVNSLNDVKNTYGVYDRIQIADAQRGIIFLSTDETQLGTEVSHLPYFTKPLLVGGENQASDEYIGDIRLSPQSEVPVFDLAHKIKDSEGTVVAILIMDVNVNDMIKPILHTGDGLGERGEALLVNKEGKILTLLKHPLPDGTIAKPFQYQIKTEPAKLAAKGKEGIIEAEDYRGEPVLAAYRYIPVTSEWGWGMVVKRDQAELFATLRQNLSYTIFTGLIGVFAFIGLTIVLSKNLTRPIESLSQTATKVADGDLDARAPVTTNDEVGSLSQTFNSMIERIQNWRKELEEQVKERTSELSETNEELTNEITERKQAERQLQKLSSAIEQSPSSIVITDAKGDIEYVNPRFSEVTGYSYEEAIGKNPNVLKSGKHPPEFYDDMWKTISSGGVWRGEFLNKTKNGELFWESASIAPITDESGAVTHFVAVKEDITARKYAEEELRVAKDEAERANEAKSQFLSSMSHELRTPMNAILGFAQLLESDTVEPLSESQLESMKQILKSGRHLLQLINEVLNLSRIESGRLSVSMGSVAVNPLISDVIALIEPMARERGIKFKEPSKKCPDYYLRADPMCIKQVLLNFLSNAVKYNKVGGSVSISCEELPEKSIRIKVTDTGPGIPKEKIDDLFKPFDRLGAEVTEIEGTGIGLTIAKRLMGLMGGKLGVESTPGSGSCFYADLAIAKKPGLEKMGVLSKSIPTAVQQESDRKNLVLFIDDDHASQALIKNILKLRPNISLLYASQSQLGIDLAFSHRPDLILLDINMPDMDGYDVLKRLKTNNETQNIPVFAVSGNAMPHDIEKGTNAGFVRYITKPFDVFEFLQMVDVALGSMPNSDQHHYIRRKKRGGIKNDLKTANS